MSNNTIRVIRVGSQDRERSSSPEAIPENSEVTTNNETGEYNVRRDENVTHDEGENSENSNSVMDDSDVPMPAPRERRFSLGKIPIPPVTMTIEDIKEAAKNSENPEEVLAEVKTTADPRRSSVNLDVFKSFRESKSKKNLPNKDQVVYVETKGRFRSMKKGTFQIERLIEKEKEDELEKQRNFIAPTRYHDIAFAFHAQRTFNQFANIVQGFLAGISVTLAVFSFNFNADVLIGSYRWMSLPVHAAFLIAFSFGLLTSIDRTGLYKSQHFTSRVHFRQTIMNNGLLGVLIWSGGLLSTLLCIQFDSSLALKPTVPPSNDEIIIWRGYSVIRAICASVGWLLLAFNSNSDVVSNQLRGSLLKSMKLEGTARKEEPEQEIVWRERILKALNM